MPSTKPSNIASTWPSVVEPWSYLKFPYLKKIGWKGFVDGPESGVYKATPLSRCNAADAMATPLAQAEYEKFYDVLGGKPVHHTLATHWARLVELLYAAERWLELAADPEITSKEYRVLPTETPTEGVGCVEAPRGTLTHHYATDERGILTMVNLIVGTTNNNAPICMSVKKAAQTLIGKGRAATEGLLNMVEMAFRAYDPCFGLRDPQLARPDAVGSGAARPRGPGHRAAFAVPLVPIFHLPRRETDDHLLSDPGGFRQCLRLVLVRDTLILACRLPGLSRIRLQETRESHLPAVRDV